MPFTTPNRTLQNDCNPKGDFHQYSVRALSKKYERATCQIVPFDKGSSVVSGEDHGCVKDFLSDCFFSSLLFSSPWLFWLLFTTGWPRWTRFNRVCTHSQLGNNAGNKSAALVTALFNWWNETERKVQWPTGGTVFPHISGSRCLSWPSGALETPRRPTENSLQHNRQFFVCPTAANAAPHTRIALPIYWISGPLWVIVRLQPSQNEQTALVC